MAPPPPPPPKDDDGGIWDPTGPDKHAKSVGKNVDAYEKLKDAKKAAADVAKPDLGHLKNFEDLSNRTAQAQESLAQQIQRSTKEIIDQAKEIGSLRSQVSDVSGAIKGFGSEMKKTASITHQYTLAMKEFKQGSEAYTQSLSLSTAKLGQASAETTKFMKATQHAYNEAYNVAKLYGLEVDAVRQQMNKLQTTFASQLSVTDNQGKALVRLTKDAMMFARTAGVDTSEAIQRMDERLQASNMTMEETRIEQLLVMKEIDRYKVKLQELGKEAMKTGNITSKDLVKALQQVRQEFKMGAYDAGTFSKTFTTMTLRGKKLGLTTEQIRGTFTGFSKVMQGFSKQEGFVGMTGSLEMLEKFGQLAGPIGKFAREQKKLVETGKETPFQAGEAIMERAEGSPEAMKLLAKIARESIPSALRGHMLKEYTGSALQASVINQMLESGEYKKIFEKQAKMTKKEKEKEAEAFKTPMEKLVKEAHTAQSTRHKAAKALFDLKKTITKWIEKYWYMMAAIQAGGQLFGRFGRGGAGMAGRGGAGMAGRGGAGMAGGGGALASAGTMLALAATAKGLHTAWGTYQKGDTGGALATAAASPFVGGYQIGQAGEKAVGKHIAKGMSREFQTTLGKDKSLTNILGTMAMDNKLIRTAITGQGDIGGLPIATGNIFGAGAAMFSGTSATRIEKGIDRRGWEMIKKERIGLDWKDFNRAKELYRLRAKEIKILKAKEKQDGYLSKKDQELLEKKKEEIRLMNKKIAGLKRAMREEKESRKKGKVKVWDYDKKKAVQELGKEFTTESFKRGDIQTAKDVQTTMRGVISSLVGTGKVQALAGGRESLEALSKSGTLGGLNLAKFMKIAQARGISREQFGQMWESETSAWREQRTTKGPPITVPAQEAELLKKRGKIEIGLDLRGDDKGATGEKRVVTKPDGSIEEETTILTSLRAKVKVAAEDVMRQHYQGVKGEIRQTGNKQKR